MAKQVIAYEAFNGKLFPTLEKCEAYEKKMKKYPYSNDKTKQLVDSFSGEIIDFVRHDVTDYISPNKAKRHTFFIVGGRYKFVVESPDVFEEIFNINAINKNDESSSKSKLVAKLILQGNELTTQYLISNLGDNVIVEEISKNKWKIYQKGWYLGAKVPAFYWVEKIS